MNTMRITTKHLFFGLLISLLFFTMTFSFAYGEQAEAESEDVVSAEYVENAAAGDTASEEAGQFFLRFREKDYTFSSKPIAFLDDKPFLCASDPDFQKLFDDMGLTYSWYSFSNRLFVYLRCGSITWETLSKSAKVGDETVELPTASCKNLSSEYIPLDSLAQLLNLQLNAHDDKGYIEIKPSIAITSEISEEYKTPNIVLWSASDIKYEARYQADPPSLRLTLPGAGFSGEHDRFFVEGVQVRINDKLDKDKLYVTLEFPPHWKGAVVPSGCSNEITVQMKPNLAYAYGIKDERLNAVELSQYGEQVYALFKTSAIVNYYWSFDPDESVLYVDLPFCSPDEESKISGFQSTLIKDFQINKIYPDGINLTRIRIDLEPGAGFMIGPPEEQEDYSFALLIGSKDKLPDPSPLIGGSRVILTMVETDNNIIVIDPGHGGSDPGAYNRQYGIAEKDITLCIAKRMADILSKEGWQVYLTRYTDTDVTYPGSPDADELKARAELANRLNAAVFISIHCNASVKSDVRGSSIHWYKDIDKDFAMRLEGTLGANIGTVEKGSRRDRFLVLRHSKVPSVLVEAAFMSNPHDIKLLMCTNTRQKIAQNLSRAVSGYVREENLARRARRTEGAEE